MPTCVPEQPEFAEKAHSERVVWESLRTSLPDEALLLHSVWFVHDTVESEADLIVVWPEAGIAVIEVKGGQVARQGGQWVTGRNKDRIDPVRQAQDARHELQRYLRAHGLSGLRSVHMVALPNMRYAESPAEHELPRELLIDERDLRGAASRVRAALEEHARGNRPPTADDAGKIARLVGGQLPKQSELLAAALEHEQRVELLTRAQGHTLRLLRYHTRLIVTGGAGTGKTWLALEQARRLAKDGQRVALLCYSRGLGKFLADVTLSWPARERPAYVGLFHELALSWGAAAGADDDADYWENDLPRELGAVATAKPFEELFDSVIVDEAQDFGELWWPSLLKCLRSEASGGIYVFLDPAQQVFDRHGVLPIDMPPIVLEENVRNTRRIAEVFQSLSLERMQYRGGDGPPVRLLECDSSDAVRLADRAVTQLQSEGWDPGEIALLTTQSRHPNHVTAVDSIGWDGYWHKFAAGDAVFYGHVLGFKGLERPAVVLAVNGFKQPHRAKQMLYVGLSRARSMLVVVGDLESIAGAGGEGVRKRLERAEHWSP